MQIDRSWSILNAILKFRTNKKKIHSIKNFIIFEHSFNHLPTITPFTIMSYGITNAQHTFFIIYTKPNSMSRSSPTKNRTYQLPSKKSKKKNKKIHAEILGVWKPRTICPAVNHWNVKRVSRNDTITMSYVVLLIYAIMIGHWQWNIVPHEVYLFKFNFPYFPYTLLLPIDRSYFIFLCKSLT